MDPCSLPPPTHTHKHTRAPPLRWDMCIDIGLRRHSRISRIHSDTRRLKCVFTPALAHTDSRTDRWTDTCFYVRRNPLGSPGCACSRAHGPTFPATQPREQRNVHAPLFLWSRTHNPSRAGTVGQGLPDAPTSAISLRHRGHLSVPTMPLLPVLAQCSAPF